MSDDNYKKALNRAMALCSKSEKCIRDVTSKLTTWGLSSAHQNETIIQELLKEGFIDEKRYAGSYALDKYRLNKWGRIKIRAMLRSRGLNEKDIEYGLDMIDQDDYLKMIKEEMSNKKKSIRAGNLFDLKARLYRFAGSRGYEKEYIHDFISKLD
ncbi:MAG TPA: RecX family transcriptional regulator [Desulfobacteraceae bacterium]|nr:RecX family transcriptional regulator [Desulfobacteraceae bacterium]